MKKINSLILSMALTLISQAQNNSKDTIKVSVNGQESIVIGSNIGKKTVLTFEDSSSVFQVSVTKYMKNNMPNLNDFSKNSIIVQPEKTKHVRWFSEITLGALTNPFQSKNFSRTKSIFQDDQTFNFNVGNTIPTNATTAKVEYNKLNTGFRFELFIKEKTKLLSKKSNLYFVSGSRFQYNRMTSSGTSTFNTYKTDSARNIKYDSLISSYSTPFNSRLRNVKYTIPLILEKRIQFNQKTLSLQAGILLGFGFNSSTLVDKTGTNLKNKYSLLELNSSSFITIQPTLRFLYNERFSFNITYDLNRLKLGFGKAPILNTNPLCFSLGYRLYK